LLPLAAAAFIVACGSDDGSSNADPNMKPPGSDKKVDPAQSEAEATAQALAEKPWEVVSNKGETYLPNVFYADPSENEQIIPYAIDGHVMIDRLIYPTLGNPNLYVKADPTDEFMTVVRIEDEAYAHLGAEVQPVQGSSLSRLVLPHPNDPTTSFAVFLVSRSARDAWTASTNAASSGNGTGVYRLYPNEILVNPIPADIPAALKARKTLRFIFRQGAMAKVPAGLYDVRFEVKKEDEIYLPRPGGNRVFEYQFNAVRVYDREPEEYDAINVTDTQVSIGTTYDSKTKDKLSEFVQYMNTSTDAKVKGAKFITFNGDLHNGGSPASMRQRTVSRTYNGEAKAIVDALKYLPHPIFLTTGNHDGYVSTGQVPSAVETIDSGLGDSLEKVVSDVVVSAQGSPWAGFSWTDFKSFLDKTEAEDALGGRHRDLFTGGFARNPKGKGFADGWKEIPKEARNYILYDGFYQWQKTYGPLYYSWKFGKNHYVSLNSFELRQHRRTGWGIYTVNYGGGMSDVQMAWLDRELLRGKLNKSDMVLLAHHDPRGGHKGTDAGYYYEQLEYKSVFQSAINYLLADVWNPAVCKLPTWALPRNQEESCVHDGLQEWMRLDEEFDCPWENRNAHFKCKGPATWMSGMELMKRVAQNAHVRTFILGHTHYNSLEVLQGGDQLLPGKLPIDSGNVKKFATLEIENPIRAFSFQQDSTGTRKSAEFDAHAVPFSAVERNVAAFSAAYENAMPGWSRTLGAPGAPAAQRELVILRLVSNADLTSQTTSDGRTALGFGVLHVTKKKDARGVDLAQVNGTTFFVNAGSNNFTKFATINLDRNARLTPHDVANPVQQKYLW